MICREIARHKFSTHDLRGGHLDPRGSACSAWRITAPCTCSQSPRYALCQRLHRDLPLHLNPVESVLERDFYFNGQGRPMRRPSPALTGVFKRICVAVSICCRAAASNKASRTLNAPDTCVNNGGAFFKRGACCRASPALPRAPLSAGCPPRLRTITCADHAPELECAARRLANSTKQRSPLRPL